MRTRNTSALGYFGGVPLDRMPDGGHPRPVTEMSAAVSSTRLPRPRKRQYTQMRADELEIENVRMGLPSQGGFVRSMLELEAEAERCSLIFAGRTRFYSRLYYLLGLPAAILAAIAGATALASTTGRIAAGVIALASSALSAAVTFLDSGGQRDRSAQDRLRWDDLYNAVHVERLTKLSGYTVDDGPAALNRFYMQAANIRAGREPDSGTPGITSPGYGDEPPQLMFPADGQGTQQSRTTDSGAGVGNRAE